MDRLTKRLHTLPWGQLTRFGLVGLTQNGVLYLAYLALTIWAGMSPKLVITLIYPCGVALSFFGNKVFTFKSKGHTLSTGLRFAGAHLLGYGLNVLLLVIGVDWLGYPHELVQLGCIFTVAAFLFAACKWLVFTPLPTLAIMLGKLKTGRSTR